MCSKECGIAGFVHTRLDPTFNPLLPLLATSAIGISLSSNTINPINFICRKCGSFGSALVKRSPQLRWVSVCSYKFRLVVAHRARNELKFGALSSCTSWLSNVHSQKCALPLLRRPEVCTEPECLSNQRHTPTPRTRECESSQ